MKDAETINKMHNLIFLFQYKTHQVFQGRVIHQIIDQNWDMKGFKAVLMRILLTLEINKLPESIELENFLEKAINT